MQSARGAERCGRRAVEGRANVAHVEQERRPAAVGRSQELPGQLLEQLERAAAPLQLAAPGLGIQISQPPRFGASQPNQALSRPIALRANDANHRSVRQHRTEPAPARGNQALDHGLGQRLQGRSNIAEVGEHDWRERHVRRQHVPEHLVRGNICQHRHRDPRRLAASKARHTLEAAAVPALHARGRRTEHRVRVEELQHHAECLAPRHDRSCQHRGGAILSPRLAQDGVPEPGRDGRGDDPPVCRCTGAGLARVRGDDDGCRCRQVGRAPGSGPLRDEPGRELAWNRRQVGNQLETCHDSLE